MITAPSIAEATAPAEVRRRTAPIGYVLGVAACLGILVITPSGRAKWDAIYAEDGGRFLADALRRSWPGVLIQPYAGYMHLVPRLVAGIAALLPIGLAPIVFTGASMLVRALLAAFVFKASENHLGGTAFRLLAAAAFVAVPAGETRDNTANLHWYLIAAAFWAVLWRPRSWAGSITATVVVIAAVDSDPLTLALAPLVLLRFVSLRGWRDQLVGIGYVAAAGLQLYVALDAGGLKRPGYPWTAMPGIASARVVLPLVVGRSTDAALTGAGLFVAAAAIVVALTWPGLTAGPPQRTVVLGVLAVDAVLLVVMWQHAGHAVRHPSRTLVGNSRYAVTPTILLVSLVAASLSKYRFRVRLMPALLCGAVAGVVLGTMLWGQTTSHSRTGPHWRAEIRAARTDCRITGEQLVPVPIYPIGWHATIPCRTVVH